MLTYNMSNETICNKVHAILLTDIDDHNSDALNMFFLPEYSGYDELHEAMNDGLGQKIAVTSILEAILVVEEFVTDLSKKMNAECTTDELLSLVETAWKTIWAQLLSDHRIRVVPSTTRKKFKVV